MDSIKLLDREMLEYILENPYDDDGLWGIDDLDEEDYPAALELIKELLGL